MRIIDWSSDVCSSDLEALLFVAAGVAAGEQDVVQHLLGDITSAQVVGAWDRRPGRTAANRSIKGLVKAVEVGDIGDRKRVVSGKSVYESVDLGGRRFINKKTKEQKSKVQIYHY